jgi:hypothetical protein
MGIYFSIVSLTSIATFSEAKMSTNITVSVCINARNGIFNLPLSDHPPILAKTSLVKEATSVLKL